MQGQGLRAACCLCALGPHLQLAQHDLGNLTLATFSSLYLSTPSFCSPACLPEPGSVMPCPSTGPACQAGPELLLPLPLLVCYCYC